MGQYLDDFVPCLHAILSDDSRDRRIKLPAIQALGDLCIHCGHLFNQKFLGNTLQILSLAARTSTQVTGYQGDEDTIEFLKSLREATIDQYAAIVMSAVDTESLDIVSPFLENIFVFLTEALKASGEVLDARLIRLVIGLVGDIASAFPEH